MGITGLHAIIKPILKTRPIMNYNGRRIGIDGHGWIYMISHIFAEDIYHGIPIVRHAELFLEKVRKLVQCQITPVIIFDGDKLISKEITNTERFEKKAKIRKEVQKALKQGALSRAKTLMRQCISITKDHLIPVIDSLHRAKIEYIISPYESDAQLCYLQNIGYIDYIITEDSDLVVFGADRILYKFDGSCVKEYSKSDLKRCKGAFFADNILPISILSGCDYLKSCKGMGILTAYKLLKKHGNIDSVIQHLSISKNLPKDYHEDFVKAFLTFKHQIVYDPQTKKREYLNHAPESMLNLLKFLGTVEHDAPYEFSKGKHLTKTLGALSAYGISHLKVNKEPEEIKEPHKNDFSEIIQSQNISILHPNSGYPLLKDIINETVIGNGKAERIQNSPFSNSIEIHSQVENMQTLSSSSSTIHSQIEDFSDPYNRIVSQRITLLSKKPKKKDDRGMFFENEDENCPLFDNI